MPSWSPAHEYFGVVWSVLSSVLLRPFVLVTWWNDRVTDCDPRVRVMTLAVSSPQKNKQPGQLCKSALAQSWLWLFPLLLLCLFCIFLVCMEEQTLAGSCERCLSQSPLGSLINVRVFPSWCPKAQPGPYTQETGMRTGTSSTQNMSSIQGLYLEILPSLHPTFQSLTPVCRINRKEE